MMVIHNCQQGTTLSEEIELASVYKFFSTGRNLRLATRRFELTRWSGSLAVFWKTASRRSGYGRQAAARSAGRAKFCSRRAASSPDQFGFFAAAPANHENAVAGAARASLFWLRNAAFAVSGQTQISPPLVP